MNKLTQSDLGEIRRLINMLRGLYANTGAQIYASGQPDYSGAAASNGVSVSPDSMGFLTYQNILFFNLTEIESFCPTVRPFVSDGRVTTLHGPTFYDAIHYAFYRLVCNFVGKNADLTEDDLYAHANDLKQREAARFSAGTALTTQPLLQDVRDNLDLMRPFVQHTPLEQVLDRLYKKHYSVSSKLSGMLGIFKSK